MILSFHSYHCLIQRQHRYWVNLPLTLIANWLWILTFHFVRLLFKVLQTIQVVFILIEEALGLLEVVYLKTNLVFMFNTSGLSQFFHNCIPNLFYLITRSTYYLILFLPVFILQYRPLMDLPFSWMIFYHHFYSTNSLHCLCSCFQNEQQMSHSHFKHRLIKHRDFCILFFKLTFLSCSRGYRLISSKS